ncbi:MAG: HAMP domain-containing protein [Oceanospirillaceae bacterium]|nr:HAMP domain-containing protein [Oceanospirillaceae bacterium]
MLKIHWLGIRGRLLLAFAVLSAFTIFSSVVGWLSHNRLEQELTRVVEGNLYTLQLVADIKERAAKITIIAPSLLQAKDDAAQDEIWQLLNANIAAIAKLLPRVVTLSSSPQLTITPSAQLEKLNKTLAQLDENVVIRLKVVKAKEALNQRLRWAGAAFLSDIDSLEQQIENDQYQRFSQHLPSAALFNNQDTQRLYRLKADVNLLINLLERAQHLPDINSLIAIHIHSDQLIDQINTDLPKLKVFRSQAKLRQTLENIVRLAQGEGNIFSIRRELRAIGDQGQLQVNKTHQALDSLNIKLGELALGAQQASQLAVRNARATIRRDRVWMVSLVAASLLFSLLFVWLYVGRNMVARITALDSSMRAIANGNLEREVAVKGRDEIGAMARSLLSFRDQLATLQEDLVQAGKLAALGQLSAGIAHEINQPLFAISHYARNGIRLIELDRKEETQKNLQQISNLTKRATAIITRLKYMARDQQAVLLPIEMSAVIHNAVKMLVGDEIRDQTHIEINIEQRSNLVLADQIQLEQVLLNLLTNALDALRDAPQKNIVINCMHSADYIEVRVMDTGLGISEEMLKKIFDPFFSTKRRGQNLGLGLSISFNIIKSFQGKLSVENSAHSGAIFCIQLPHRGKV